MEQFEQLEKQLREELKVKGFCTDNGNGTKTYRTILHEGDLPGDQGLDWWTQEDWDRHARHVAELKAKGTYGKPWGCEMTLKHIPAYDEPTLNVKSVESYRFEMIDFSK